MNLKFWSYVAIFVAGVIVGIGIGVVGTTNKPRVTEPIRYQIEIVYPEGKRSPPGVLSPETIHAIELQTAREMFNGKMLDPFARKAKMHQYRWEQQRCLEEQELGGER